MTPAERQTGPPSGCRATLRYPDRAVVAEAARGPVDRSDDAGSERDGATR